MNKQLHGCGICQRVFETESEFRAHRPVTDCGMTLDKAYARVLGSPVLKRASLFNKNSAELENEILAFFQRINSDMEIRGRVEIAEGALAIELIREFIAVLENKQKTKKAA